MRQDGEESRYCEHRDMVPQWPCRAQFSWEPPEDHVPSPSALIHLRSKEAGIYSLPKAAMTKTKDLPLGGLTNKNCLSSEGEDQGVCRAVMTKLFHASPLASIGLPATFGIPWFGDASLQAMLWLSYGMLPVCLCLHMASGRSFVLD